MKVQNDGLLIKEALSSISQGLLIVDSLLNIVFANERFCRMLEVPPDLVGPGTPVEPMHRYLAHRGEYGPGDPEAHVQFRQEAIRSGRDYRLDRRRPNGDFLEVTGNRLQSGGSVFTFTDVTERRRENERLERLVEERTNALEETNRELRRLAVLDPLLDIPNRRRFMEVAEAERLRSLREGIRLSVMMVDADHFKVINDTHGHPVGDAVLHALSVRLQTALRITDTLARYGGEEFVVLLPHTSLDEAATVAERLRRTVAADPIAAHDRFVPMTVSLGLAEWHPGEADIAGTLKRADDALYVAKQMGRDRAVRAPWPALPAAGTTPA